MFLASLARPKIPRLLALAALGAALVAAGACSSAEPQVMTTTGGGTGGGGGCPPGLADCSGKCVQTDFDPAHCGGCGSNCDQGQVCSQGH
ncbi:MAG: hypothetical protein HY744_03565 [Deltaproteobacteria bacterium]|nr:hypothetical protein [Deltaproteobacteria bacterium]